MIRGVILFALNGCSEQFYKSIKFKACLWPTSTRVWNNDLGQGINTGPFNTFKTRKWMDEIVAPRSPGKR